MSVLPCVRAASGETYALVPLDHALKDLRGNLPESGTLTLVEGELAPACGTAGEPLLATVTRALLLAKGEAVSGRASTGDWQPALLPARLPWAVRLAVEVGVILDQVHAGATWLDIPVTLTYIDGTTIPATILTFRDTRGEWQGMGFTTPRWADDLVADPTYNAHVFKLAFNALLMFHCRHRGVMTPPQAFGPCPDFTRELAHLNTDSALDLLAWALPLYPDTPGANSLVEVVGLRPLKLQDLERQPEGCTGIMLGSYLMPAFYAELLARSAEQGEACVLDLPLALLQPQHAGGRAADPRQVHPVLAELHGVPVPRGRQAGAALHPRPDHTPADLHEVTSGPVTKPLTGDHHA